MTTFITMADFGGTGHPPATALENGDWLFREDDSRWWRLARVQHGLVNAVWLTMKAPVDRLVGEWRKPSSDEVARASSDVGGRLLPEKIDHA